jgi:hypothetical protein
VRFCSFQWAFSWTVRHEKQNQRNFETVINHSRVSSNFFLKIHPSTDLMTGVAMFRARNLLNNPLQNPVLPDIGFDLLPYPKICEGSLLPTYLLLILMCTQQNFITFISSQQRVQILLS